MALNARQRKFIAEYLKDPNATKAAIKAGYSKKTARAIGAENLTKPDIAAELAAHQAQVAERAGVTAERVVTELAQIAFSDFRKFAKWGPNGVTLTDSESLSEDDARCISEVSETITKKGGTVRFKLHDKKGALDSLARHLGMFTEKIDLTSGGKPLPADERSARLEAMLKALTARLKRK